MRGSSMYGSSTFGGSAIKTQQSPSKLQNSSIMGKGKLTCESHTGQKITAICLKEDCPQPSRLACFQCMTSNHTECSKYFCSIKEIKKISPKSDVFEVYNYPTELLDPSQYEWITNYQNKLTDSENEINIFFDGLKDEITNLLENQKHRLLETMVKKREAVENHVKELKTQLNSTFSLDNLKQFIAEVSAGTMTHDRFNEEVTNFIADEKKHKVRNAVQGDVESLINLYNFGFIQPILSSAQQIKAQILDLTNHLQAKLLSPMELALESGDFSFGNGSKYIFDNPEAKTNVQFAYKPDNTIKFQEANSSRTRIKIQDLNEDPSIFGLNIGVYSREDGGNPEESGNYISLGQTISTKHKGEHENKRWNQLSKDLPKGVTLDIEFNIKKSQFSVYQLNKEDHPMLVFRNNATQFQSDKKDWVLNLFSKPENKFSLEILESYLYE